jgi:hypothetical protein
MKKMVILSDNSDRSSSRVMLLKVLFPECEIKIRPISPDVEDLKSYPFGPLSENSLSEEIER